MMMENDTKFQIALLHWDSIAQSATNIGIAFSPHFNAYYIMLIFICLWSISIFHDHHKMIPYVEQVEVGKKEI